jgi:translation initiation factor IF-2
VSSKKRVYELAKEYGMSGQDLAAKLKELGVSEVKGPSSALDETQWLVVQARLEAHGIIPESAKAAKAPEAALAGAEVGDSGIKVKRKKKVSLGGAEGPSPTSAAESPPVLPAAAPVEPSEPAPEVPADAKLQEPAKLQAESEPQVPAESERAPEPEASAPPAPSAQPTLEPEPGDLVSALEETPSPVPSEVAPSRAASAEAGVPALRKPAGKVLGFIDLSKQQTARAAPKPDTKRLRSKDDVTPDVQPTLGHDRKKALLRSDHAQRGQLTPAQLREKESARYLRRRTPTTGQGAAPAAGRPSAGRGRGQEARLSPVAGSEITVDTPVTIKKLADSMSVKSSLVLGKAFALLGQDVNINSILDDETAALIALEFEVTLKVAQEIQAETVMREELARKRTAVEEAELVIRPPTVAFLGHVDHGKTTLIDSIRDSRIAAGEAGGITQHVGAYMVPTRSGKAVTILDTPGHEAFSAMRARGAKAVDIVVLVVAADDGPMPATIEAINHARAAKVPIVVAINKCDRPDANPARVKQELTKHGLLSEEYGGEVPMVEVSGLKKTGLDSLLEQILLKAEYELELKAHAKGPASGVVIEAEIHPGKGMVASLLVKDGTLSRGDVILAGEGYGRVRSLHDDRGQIIQSAGPSTPVMVSGLDELPTVGDPFFVVEKLEQAREVAEERRKKNRMMSFAERRQVTAENLMQAVADKEKKIIHLILRCDVQGSLQALSQQISTLVHPEVDVKLLQAALGTVSESDVHLAMPSGAVILAFRVGVDGKARTAAERAGVEIRNYEVIYELLDEIRAMMEGVLSPEIAEQVLGHVEVRKLFQSSKFGTIAGCHVLDGTVTRDSKVRVMRGKELVTTTQIASLRREKDEAREVREGFDCGVTLKDFDSFQEGDVLEAFKLVTSKRLLKI